MARMLRDAGAQRVNGIVGDSLNPVVDAAFTAGTGIGTCGPPGPSPAATRGTSPGPGDPRFLAEQRARRPRLSG